MVRKVGTGGKDKLNGTSSKDFLFGLGGNDIIKGKAGNDVIDGGSGNDTLFGGNGKDKITGGSGNDQISGDAGNDIIVGGAGKDFIAGGDGNDTLIDTAGGLQLLDGGNGNDRIVMSGDTGSITQSFSYLFGRAGRDVLADGDGNSALFGGTGADTIAGGKGADFMVGGDSPVGGGDGSADRFVFNDGDGFQNNVLPGFNRFDDVILDFEAGLDQVVLVGALFFTHEDWDDTANGNGTGLRIIYNDGSGVAATFFVQGYSEAQFAITGASDFIIA